MSDAVLRGSPDPGKQIFNLRNFMLAVGAILAASWALLMWNVKGAVDDIHTAVSTANSAQSLATTNKDAIERISRTESRIANIVVDHETRLSIVEQHDHIARQPSIRLYDGR